MSFQKICVIGLGYIGLPTAATFATHGLKVIGVDINSQVIETLRSGEIHFHEPGLGDVFKQAIRSGNFSFSMQPEEADAFLIAVPTPFQTDVHGEYDGRKYKLADMRAVRSATEAIVPHLRKGNLVVLESTSPPRTTIDLVAPILERSGLKAGSDFFLCYSPERVLPGQIMRELIENARVVGGVTPESAKAGRAFYQIFVKGEIIETDTTTAEMVKLMENTTRDVNIAIANEFSRLAERFGVDVWEAISLANRHPRINILSPGPGVGGHCISVDPWFFVEAAPELTSLIYHARQVNNAQPSFVIEKVKQAFRIAQAAILGGEDAAESILSGKKIAALGLAYKPDVDDLRESPATEVVHLLQEEGAQVKVWEPFKPDANMPGIDMASSLEATLKDADVILLLVKHTEFINFDPEEIASKTSTRRLIDCVNGWNTKKWQKAGFQLHRLGDNKSPI
ncbi:MAG: nucleotide sugar dehydrogenase [Anaerolineae bacterium]|nr:nucleotide sugar dehydrogenase [Anaerolineae bacterium]MCI0608527.1 nucleotide sugar dehydrogenase [Anaerolineae bacterium]